ncbi:MAG TPA: NADH dehydrogenase (quinone) subunit D [Gemmataceae bacterium]|nr:NADH dehydrogenase (quinone) subunit D [Gemmataceae bacterium]
MPLELADAIALPEGPDREYLWTLNFGPQHPATHTTLRLILTLDGETIVKAVPDIGYLHSGFEKLGEHLDYNQYVTIVDRKNYISPVANEIAWFAAVEKLMGIDLTPRCQYIRVIFNELMRIHDHLLACGAAALDLGGFTAFLYAFNQKEKIYDICERAAGQRFHPSYLRVGGLLRDVDETWIDMVRAFVREFPRAWNDIVRLLNRNRIFIERTKDIGVLSKEDANNLSCTGPVARASGVVRDLRKDEPYLAYKDFDFKVICAREGDCYARYLVRMEEMLESCDIIHQAIEHLPSGAVNVDVESKVVMPNQLSVYRSIEGLIHHFELIMTNRQWRPPVDEVYAAIESPNGELGYYLISDGSGVAYRTRTRPPSFIHFAIFPYLIVGHQVSDVVAVLGSLNIIAAELDR